MEDPNNNYPSDEDFENLALGDKKRELKVNTNSDEFQVKDESISSAPNNDDLIEWVRKFPELYDKKHPKYMNNVHKAVLWSEIARKTGFKGTIYY
jgi:hypothetical protein